MPEVRSPTLRRRELGALLRAHRLDLGLTVDQVAERLLCSPSKVSRMETGQRGATQRDVRDLCALYGITGEEECTRLMTLAREGKQQGWWQPFELPYSTYVGLEQEALSMKPSRRPDCRQPTRFGMGRASFSMPYRLPELRRPDRAVATGSDYQYADTDQSARSRATATI